MAIFEPVRAVRKLRDKGVPEPAAEATVEVAQEAAAAATSELATKADIAAVQSDIAELRAANKADIAEVKAEIYRAMWLFGLGVVTVNLTGIGVATGIIVAFA